MTKPQDLSTFGKRLRAARIAAGLTQAQLGKRAGFKGQSAIGNIEQGERDASGRTAALARACGIEAYWLETGEGEMKSTLTGTALDVATLISALPQARQEGLAELIRAAIGQAVPDAEVERKMPATSPATAETTGKARRKK